MTREEKEKKIERILKRVNRLTVWLKYLEGRVDFKTSFIVAMRTVSLVTEAKVLASQPTDEMKIKTIDSGGISIC